MHQTKRTLMRTTVTLTLGLLLGACATPTGEPTAGPITVTDGLGREISLPEPARRVVSLAPANTEILFALGGGSLLVGRDDFSDYPPEALEAPNLGDVYGELNTEAVVALEPDLVLAAELTPLEQIDEIESLGVTVFALANPLDFEGLYANLESVGRLTGHEAEAAALAESLRARVEAVTERLAGVEPVSVYYEVDASDVNAPWTTGSGTFQQLLIEMTGGENVAADIQGWGQISLEELVARDPEVVIFGAGTFVPTTPESVAERPGWSDIAAVANGAVYSIDTDLTDLPGPRLVDGLEAMAKLLHPERFE